MINAVPLERILIETDAPYQSPVRDHRHEPADVVRIYSAIAQIKEIPSAELMQTVSDNFDNVFHPGSF